MAAARRTREPNRAPMQSPVNSFQLRGKERARLLLGRRRKWKKFVNRNAKTSGEHDEFRVGNPPGLSLDLRDGVALNVPPDPLTLRCKGGLRQPRRAAEPAQMRADDVASALHEACRIRHWTLKRRAGSTRARMSTFLRTPSDGFARARFQVLVRTDFA